MPDETSLAVSYAQGFDGHLSFGTAPALLLVDVVMAYLTRGSPLYDNAFVQVLPVIEVLAAAARAKAIPVIFTRVVYTAAGADGGLFYRKLPALRVFDGGSPLGEFPPSLSPTEVEIVITKQYASAFFATHLASTLNALRIETLLIAGFSTSGCVRASALDALQHGFKPFVVADACADRHAGPHTANLFDLQAKYAEIISVERALKLLPI